MSYPGRDFDPLDVTEIVVLSFDFTKVVQVGEAITSQAWTCEVIEGADASADARLIGSSLLSDAIVSHQFGALVAGVKYRIVAAVDTNIGNRYVLWSHIEGVQPH